MFHEDTKIIQDYNLPQATYLGMENTGFERHMESQGLKIYSKESHFLSLDHGKPGAGRNQEICPHKVDLWGEQQQKSHRDEGGSQSGQLRGPV